MRLAVGSSAVPLEAFFDFDDFPFDSSAPFSFSGPSSRIHSSNAITPRKFLSSGFFVYASCRPETKSVNCKTNPYRLTWTKLETLILPTAHWYLSLYHKLTHLWIFLYLFREYVSLCLPCKSFHSRQTSAWSSHFYRFASKESLTYMAKVLG